MVKKLQMLESYISTLETRNTFSQANQPKLSSYAHSVMKFKQFYPNLALESLETIDCYLAHRSRHSLVYSAVHYNWRYRLLRPASSLRPHKWADNLTFKEFA